MQLSFLQEGKMSHAIPFGNIFRLISKSPKKKEKMLNHEVKANLDDFGVISRNIYDDILDQVIESNRETMNIEPGGLLDQY